MQKTDPAFRLVREVDLTELCVDGDRVRLRSLNERFAHLIFKEFSNKITRFMIPKPADTIDDTLAFIQSAIHGMTLRNDLTFVVLKKDDEEFLGCCGIHGRENTRTPELGIWIKESAHGRNYGREAVVVACQWALKHIEFEYLIYPVDRNNFPSRKIPESMGGVIFEEKRVGTLRGTELDEIVFKLTPEAVAANQIDA